MCELLLSIIKTRISKACWLDIYFYVCQVRSDVHSSLEKNRGARMVNVIRGQGILIALPAVLHQNFGKGCGAEELQRW